MKKILLSTLITLSLAACSERSPETNANTSPPLASTTTANNAQNQLPLLNVVAEIYIPFTVHHETNVGGFDHDLLQAIAKQEGFRVQFIPQAWSALFNTLEAGKADIAAGGIYITEERRKRFDLTDPYLETGTILLLGPNVKINKLSEMRGKNISVKEATVAEKTALSFLKGNGTVNRHKTLWLAVKETLSGKSDATFGDAAPLIHYANRFKEHGVTIQLNTQQPKEYYAFLVRKGNQALLDKLNRGLAELKKNGEYDRIYKKWFVEGSAEYQENQ